MSATALDIGPLISWVVALAALLSFGTSIWNIMGSGSRQNAAKIVALEMRIALTERVTQHHTDQIDQMPGKDMMHRMELSLSELHGQLGRLDERLKPVAAIAERMQELMIEQAQARK